MNKYLGVNPDTLIANYEKIETKQFENDPEKLKLVQQYNALIDAKKIPTSIMPLDANDFTNMDKAEVKAISGYFERIAK